ncbi:MAG: AAA family ATPase [Muribaculaceae bacterium]|nr:AAA family ATPase [Muribaculaceae bacterium]
MIERNLLATLNKWAAKERRKPLVIRGARQVGKTTLVKEFSKQFIHFVDLNLERREDRQLFDDADTPRQLLEILRLTRTPLPSDFSKEKTLIFIDEIQSEPKAVGMLRYFYEDYPELYVIAAGSRLQELFRTGVSFPVGRVEYQTLRPCFFDEFLSGLGKDELREIVIAGEYDSALDSSLSQLFRQFALIGGMPEIITEYSDHGSVSELSSLYRSLLQSYDEDVEKYAVSKHQVDVLRHILRNGWEHAGQTITYNRFAGSGYASTPVHEAFELLERAFLLNLAYPATSVRMPPTPAYLRSPKLIWLDSGLVNFSAQIQVEYMGNKSLIDVWRGHAVEQVVGQALWEVLDRQYALNENYWIRDKRGSNAEVDFVLPFEGRLLPIEVKSGTNAHLRSMQSYMAQEGSPGIGIRIWSGKFSVDEVANPLSGKPYRLVNLPFYMVGAIDKVVRAYI